MNDVLGQYRQQRKLNTLVENRTIYNAEFAELNIYETLEVAEKVALKFDFPIIASMLTGKKIMHIDGMPSFDFYPGESVVLPTDQKMLIDFPLATQEEPTQCLALGIDSEKISEVVDKFNSKVSIENENNSWTIDDCSNHLANHSDVNNLINRLVYTFTHNTQSKDVLLDLMIQELIVRLLQTKAKALLIDDMQNMFSDTRMGSAIKYIRQNLTNKDISVDKLAKKAHMSKSHFHKTFKNTLGISPVDYINSEKIKLAKRLIKDRPHLSISDIAFQSGFNSVSYFNRQFKSLELITPYQYKSSINQSKI